MSVDPSTVVINGATYQLAIRDGRYVHDIVSGQDLRWEHDFRSGSLGMGETVQQTPTGYLFTDNMDMTKRGMRLSPTITAVSLGSSNLPATSEGRPPVFWEAVDGTTGTATATSATTLTDSDVSPAWSASQWIGATVTAEGVTAVVTSNTTTVLTMSGGWSGTTPSATAVYTLTSGARYVYVYGNNTANQMTAWKIKVSDDSVASSKVDPASAITTGCGVGRPERWEGKQYTCASFGTTRVDCIEQLTYCGVSSGSTANDTWTAIDTAGSTDLLLRSDPTSGTAKMLRATNTNRISSVEAGASGDGPLDEANWAPAVLSAYQVGDGDGTHGIVTGGASHAGVTIIGKIDGAYAFDLSGSSYSVIPSLQRSLVSSANGFGTTSYGNLTYYNEAGGLWEIREVNRVRNVGVDAIPYYTNATNITEPIRFTHLECAVFGEWRYFIYADMVNFNNSYIMAMQKGDHSKTGLPIWHPIIKRANRIRGLFIDSGRRLWWGEPGADRVAYIQLAADGSPDGTARGTSGVSGVYRGPEIDATHFGMDSSEITLQSRYLFVETEGTFTNTSWQMEVFRDGGSVANIGSAITSATGTNINWTVGTDDTARRWRLGATVTVSGAVTAGPNDPKILRVVWYMRSPDVVTMILKPDEKNRSLFETAKILRKLKNAGPITVREPATNESASHYIDHVDLVQYSTDSGLQSGIRIISRRYSAAA